MIEDVSFRTDGGSLDLHPRPAGNKEENFIWRLHITRQPERAIVYVCYFAQTAGNKCS